MFYSTFKIELHKIDTNLGQQAPIEKMDLIWLVSRLKKENFIVLVNQSIKDMNIWAFENICFGKKFT